MLNRELLNVPQGNNSQPIAPHWLRTSLLHVNEEGRYVQKQSKGLKRDEKKLLGWVEDDLRPKRQIWGEYSVIAMRCPSCSSDTQEEIGSVGFTLFPGVFKAKLL